MENSNKLIVDRDIIFNAKPAAVPYNYRLSYRLPQIVLIIDMTCSNGGCSLVKLNMISTAISSDYDMKKLTEFTEGNIADIPIIRLDPAVNRAISFSIVDGLISQQKNGKLKLTAKGKELANRIKADTGIMKKEKEILSSIKNKISDDKLDNIMNAWRCSNAQN